MSTIKENLFVGGLGFAGDVGYTENNTMYFKEGSVSDAYEKRYARCYF